VRAYGQEIRAQVGNARLTRTCLEVSAEVARIEGREFVNSDFWRDPWDSSREILTTEKGVLSVVSLIDISLRNLGICRFKMPIDAATICQGRRPATITNSKAPPVSRWGFCVVR